MTNLTKICAAMAIFAPLTYGQDKAAPLTPAAPSTPAAAGQRPPPPGVGSAGRPVQRYDRLMQDLTPEQKTKIDEINKAFTATATPLYARLQSARRELETMVNAEQFDEAGLRAKAKEIADLEGDLAVARGQRYAKFRAFLSPDQARRLNLPTPMARPFQPAMHEGQTPPPVAPNK